MRGTVELRFLLYHDLKPAESSFGAYVRVQDVDAIYRACAEAQLPRTDIPCMRAVKDKPWSMCEFAVIDP